MNMDLSLLSVLSAALLLVFCIAGDTVLMDGISVDVSLSPSGLVLSAHPTFIVWTDSEWFRGEIGVGAAYGNVAVLSSLAKDELERWNIGFDCVVDHERRHLEQFHALGEWIWIARYVLPMEPMNCSWNDSSVELAEMWQPPIGWPWRWSFISFTFNREET